MIHRPWGQTGLVAPLLGAGVTHVDVLADKSGGSGRIASLQVNIV